MRVRFLFCVAVAAALIPAPAGAVVVEPFTKRYEAALYGDFITVGNTVIGCPQAPDPGAADCADTQAGTKNLNNNQFMMQRIDTAGMPGTFDSSTAELTIPSGATVAYARLFWGGNDGEYKAPSTTLQRCDIQQTNPPQVVRSPGDPETTQPLLRVNGGAVTPVTVEDYNHDPATLGGPHYYTAESDVTAQFAGVPSGSPIEVAVGNVWAPDGKGCVGGWSLTVVYKFPGPTAEAKSRRNIYIWGGHVLQRSQDPATTINVTGFDRFGTEPVHASITTYEGDRATAGDQFLVNGSNIRQPLTNATNNFFIGDVDGDKNPNTVNNLSIDANEFDIPSTVLPEGATSATLTFRTTNDTYVPQQLALSVPIPDLEIKKATPNKGTVAEGEKLTYTITAKNISDVDYPNAKFSDDLTKILDDADFDGTVNATSGLPSYAKPLVSWSGSIPAGETVTVTYTVTVKPKGSGDGKMINAVVSDGERAECEEGSTDPTCVVSLAVVEKLPVSGRPVLPILAAGITLLGAGVLMRRFAR